MRILLISDFYPPVIGGLERHVQLLAGELTQRGHDVTVATTAHPRAPTFEVADGVPVHRLSGWQRALASLYETSERIFPPPAPDPGLVAALGRLIRELRPELVHAHGWIMYSFLPLARRARPRTVVTLHDYGLVCPKRTYLHREAPCSGPAYAKCLASASEEYGRARSAVLTTALFLSSRMHGRVDRYLANSSAVASASARWAGNGTKPIEVVPPFIPDAFLEEGNGAERPGFLPDSDGYLIFVGAMGKHKGLNVLLESYSGMRSPRPPLVVLGTPRHDTPADFPEGVVVVHDVAHLDVMAAWRHASVAVVPSVWPEPFGQVAVEAMAAGRPVVASAVGGLPDVVLSGETGLLVPPGDAVALREAIEALLADPERRAQMGEAGRVHARSFGATRVLERLQRIYREALAG